MRLVSVIAALLIGVSLVACGAGGAQSGTCDENKLDAELDSIDTSQLSTRMIAERLDTFGLVPYKCGLSPGQETFTLIAARARFRAAIRYAQNGQITIARNDLRAATIFAQRVAVVTKSDRVHSDAVAMLADLARTRNAWRNRSDAPPPRFEYTQ